jgi:hypothetical protein
VKEGALRKWGGGSTLFGQGLLREEMATGGWAAEGTSGAVTYVPFREGANGAALKSEPYFGAVSQVSSFELSRGRVTARPFAQDLSRCCRAGTHDKRCSSQSGWGKSTAASGRRSGGQASESRSTPSLKKLGERAP